MITPRSSWTCFLRDSLAIAVRVNARTGTRTRPRRTSQDKDEEEEKGTDEIDENGEDEDHGGQEGARAEAGAGRRQVGTRESRRPRKRVRRRNSYCEHEWQRNRKGER